MLWTVKVFTKFKFCCPTSWTQKETDVFWSCLWVWDTRCLLSWSKTTLRDGV